MKLMAFMRALRKACGRSLGLPATKWMLEAASFFFEDRMIVPTGAVHVEIRSEFRL